MNALAAYHRRDTVAEAGRKGLLVGLNTPANVRLPPPRSYRVRQAEAWAWGMAHGQAERS